MRPLAEPEVRLERFLILRDPLFFIGLSAWPKAPPPGRSGIRRQPQGSDDAKGQAITGQRQNREGWHDSEQQNCYSFSLGALLIDGSGFGERICRAGTDNNLGVTAGDMAEKVVNLGVTAGDMAEKVVRYILAFPLSIKRC
ncbi:hypothetical protein BN874_460092 [Candidatus Contendobacter odensis Run_B_J11]|uniref:Uncharacterized protein n=1 Tax=Candidatus Contendobacter odensis Run_B_J11 TaxID=1400861 RepID=A0A7U7GEP2_9GAMM|nr:hypothetical protein BN874_460092 [Candidatus Contendobacter odensis Run_B_J11]